MRGSRPAMLLAVAALLLFAVVAARGESPVPSSVRDLPLERGTGGGVFSGPAGGTGFGTLPVSEDQARNIAVGIGILAVALLVVAVVLSVLDARRRRGRIGVGTVVDAAESVVETTMLLRLRQAALDAKERLARAGGAPDSAVIEAWLTLETAASADGTGRLPHQTTTEFTTALLTAHTTDEPALHELRALYQRARFSEGTTEADAERAAETLDRILAALDRNVPTATSTA